MSYKKYVKVGLLVAIIILFSAGVYQIYRVNSEFKSPEEKPVRINETAAYKGFTIELAEVALYEADELLGKYPDWTDSLIMFNYYDNSSDDKKLKEEREKTLQMICSVKIKNNSEKKLRLSMDNINLWVLEAGLYTNGVDVYAFNYLNSGVNTNFDIGDEKQIYIPYAIWKDDLSEKEIRNRDISIVYSYYPTKNYLLIKGGEIK